MSENIRDWGNRIVDRITAIIVKKLSDNHLAGWLIGAALVGLSVYIRSGLYIGTDPAFYYIIADKILHGQRYYYDFFESNFPLNFYIYTIPVLLHNLTDISPYAAMLVFTTIVPLISIYCSNLILKRTSIYADPLVYNLLLAGFFLGSFFPFATFNTNEIGTKTLLYLAFISPYFCYVIAEVEGKKLPVWATVTIGIFAGLCVCIKPHYSLFIIVMECYILWKRKTFFSLFRPVNYAIVVVNILHLLWLVFYLPEYVLKILPMLTVSYEGGTKKPIINSIQALFRIDIFVLSLFLIWWRKLPHSGINTLLLMAVFGGALIFYTEGLGSWDQQSAFYFFVFLAFIKVMIDLARHHAVLSIAVKSGAIALVIVLLLTIVTVSIPFQPLHRQHKILVSLVKELSPSEPIMVLSDKMYYPLIFDTQVPYYYKIPALSFFRGIQNSEIIYQNAPEGIKKRWLAETKDYFIRSIVEGLRDHPPKLVVVSNIYTKPLYDRCQLPNLETFLGYGAFREEWKHYVFYKRFIASDSRNRITDDISVFVRKTNNGSNS